MQSVLSADKTPHTNKETVYQQKVTAPDVLLTYDTCRSLVLWIIN